MSTEASKEYLRNAVMTATPEQLQLMLYDGAIRFATQAAATMREGRYDESCEKLIRAQKIVVEMRNGLRREINPSLCDQMAALYDFIYSRLVDANLKRSQSELDEAVRVLRHQRDTWQMLIEKVRTSRDGEPAARRSAPAAPMTAGEPSLKLSIEA